MSREYTVELKITLSVRYALDRSGRADYIEGVSVVLPDGGQVPVQCEQFREWVAAQDATQDEITEWELENFPRHETERRGI